MPREIIKCEPDRDLYMEWSSIVEAPTFVGTRAELVAYLTSCKAGSDRRSAAEVEQRIARTDETGSSALHSAGCFWDASGAIHKQEGFLPRRRFTEFAERIHADPFAPVLGDLLEPFEDDAPIHGGTA